MRFVTALVGVLLATPCTALAACNVTPPSGITLNSEDQETLKDVGKIIKLGENLNSATIIGLFVNPAVLISLSTGDASTLTAALRALGKIPACAARDVVDLNLIDNNRPSRNFLNQLKSCFEDRCLQ